MNELRGGLWRVREEGVSGEDWVWVWVRANGRARGEQGMMVHARHLMSQSKHERLCWHVP